MTKYIRPSNSKWRHEQAPALKARYKAGNLPCAGCNKPFKWDLEYSTSPRHKDYYLDPDAFTVDHVVPLARGGSPTDLGNMVGMHRRCNREKGTMTLQEFLESRAEQPVKMKSKTSRDWKAVR